ncbi:Scytalone dehydratase [Hypoxylon argillaceum]|nr:Scytalone dehydratase [Hypoxylon argillaceum]KAI1152419.1 Scytalone dehydratase [Nemania diffusa]
MYSIYIPKELSFQDYLIVCQTSRTLVDGFDRKDRSRLLAALAPEVVADYSAVNPAWVLRKFTADAFVDEWLGPEHLGIDHVATHHLLGIPYFKSVSTDTIVVEWQQLASHAQRLAGEDFSSPLCKIGSVSEGKSWMEHTFVRVDGQWKISVVRPSIHYRSGSLNQIRGEAGN